MQNNPLFLKVSFDFGFEMVTAQLLTRRSLWYFHVSWGLPKQIVVDITPKVMSVSS